MGQGLNTDGNYERWHHRRTIYNQAFHRKLINLIYYNLFFILYIFNAFKFSVLFESVNQFNLKGDHLMERFLKLADGKQSVSVYDITRRATFDIISLVTINFLFI